jgi:hypothetical protein
MIEVFNVHNEPINMKLKYEEPAIEKIDVKVENQICAGSPTTQVHNHQTGETSTSPGDVPSYGGTSDGNEDEVGAKGWRGGIIDFDDPHWD